MTEITIYGRGGQGGVTLAKLTATAFLHRGKHVQAFGVYAAERSGAPLQAYVRIDDQEITNHNQIREPDHVIVLDRTLIGPAVLKGLKPDGWIILNTSDVLEKFAESFPGRKVATVDATRLAVEHGLGTKTVPIVNTTIFGAVARVLGLSIQNVESALATVGLCGGNLDSAKRAFALVNMKQLGGKASARAEPCGSELPEAKSSSSAIPDWILNPAAQQPRIRTGAWATRRPKRQQMTPPCNAVCPAGNDVQGFLSAAARGDFDAALATLLETSPFPGVCGRVCPAPCMDNCNRRYVDEPVNVRELERLAAERGRKPDVSEIPQRDEIIAVIGSGPAGLSAAYALAKLRYPVTVFDAAYELGGLLRTGIPPYRLPREVLDDEISYILAQGVSDCRGRRIGPADLQWLCHEFSAVILATGLQRERKLDLISDVDGVLLGGLSFLDRARCGGVRLDGLRVAVVGGGNTAVDAARSALRAGARSSHILYRRTRREMPAIPEEIEEAIEEGVVLHELVAPVGLRTDALGPLLTCVRMRLGEPDETGRRRPIPETAEDAYFDLRCDRLISALGQSVDPSVLPQAARFDGRPGPSDSPDSRLFVCGDFATNEGTVSAAIGSGRMTALRVHRSLTGEDLLPDRWPLLATPGVLRAALFPHSEQHQGDILPPRVRRRTFREIRAGFEGESGARIGMAEAMRCCSCGVCNYCDRCVQHCPEGIMCRAGSGYTFDAGYCKGCGVCASECPRGVLTMAEL